MRAGVNVYHVECFRCEGCDRLLVPGDEFTMQDGFLLCTDHEDANVDLITLTQETAHVTHLGKCDEGAGKHGALKNNTETKSYVYNFILTL